jgi:hypothetical protein
MNGQDMSGDGGGGGGGGGGFPGGDGGDRATSDVGGSAGFAGNSGRNNLSSTSGTVFLGSGRFPAVVDRYDVSGFATGGTATTDGTDGYAVLEINVYGLPFVKVINTWKPVDAAYVKLGGQWRQIETVYVKENGEWRPITQTDELTVTDRGTGVQYGAGGTLGFTGP